MANRAASKAVHLGVPGTRLDGTALIPFCEPGYAAFQRGSLAVVNPVEKHITCKFCQDGLRAAR